MARVCPVTGKKPLYGNKVSHANNKTRRTWQPNLNVCSFHSEILGKSISLRLSANGVRTIEKKGGIDAWLLESRPRGLPDVARKLRKQLLKAKESEAAH